MNHSTFIAMFKDIIQSDDAISMETSLEDIEEWDSMAMMALIAHFDIKFGVKVTFDMLKEKQTVHDIALLLPDGIHA